MWTSSAYLLHELLHWLVVAMPYARIKVVDEVFPQGQPAGFGLPTEARTPLLALKLEQTSPNQCVWKDFVFVRDREADIFFSRLRMFRVTSGSYLRSFGQADIS